jgi:hypothetical protein
MQLDRFWTQLAAMLDELDIRGAERLAIEGTISARAPRPTPEAVAEHRRGFEAWKAGLAALAQRRNPAHSGPA